MQRFFIKLIGISAILLLSLYLSSIIFRLLNFYIISPIAMLIYYGLLAIFAILYLIHLMRNNIDLIGKILFYTLPIAVFVPFINDILFKGFIIYFILIIYLLATDQINFLKKKNWHFMPLLIFYFIIPIVMSFISLRYSDKSELRNINQKSSSDEKFQIITKRIQKRNINGAFEVYLEKKYSSVFKRSIKIFESNWSQAPVIQWQDECNFMINHKKFNASDIIKY